jgi:Tfp pilus assembly protein FimT
MICRKHTETITAEDQNDAKRFGCNIFELMTVLGIMAIAASIAVPNFIGWLPNYRIRSAADEVLSALC